MMRVQDEGEEIGAKFGNSHLCCYFPPWFISLTQIVFPPLDRFR